MMHPCQNLSRSQSPIPNLSRSQHHNPLRNPDRSRSPSLRFPSIAQEPGQTGQRAVQTVGMELRSVSSQSQDKLAMVGPHAQSRLRRKSARTESVWSTAQDHGRAGHHAVLAAEMVHGRAPSLLLRPPAVVEQRVHRRHSLKYVMTVSVLLSWSRSRSPSRSPSPSPRRRRQ